VLHRDPRPKRESWFTAGRHAAFSRTPREGTLVSPSLGEHTREVLLEAGFDAARVEALISNGVAGAR
jgi:crotonobetainyl-CoA:carnitine CoA-transferase CaiB-like acyl-CoA transferase